MIFYIYKLLLIVIPIFADARTLRLQRRGTRLFGGDRKKKP